MPPLPAVASTPMLRQVAPAEPLRPRAPMAAAFSGLGNTARTHVDPGKTRNTWAKERLARQTRLVVDYCRMHPGPAVPGGLLRYLESNAGWLESPRADGPCTRYARARAAATAWHDLEPDARKEQSLAAFAKAHLTSKGAMRRFVDPDGRYTALMQQRLDGKRDAARYGDGPEAAAAWHNLSPGERSRTHMKTFAMENFGVGLSALCNYVNSKGEPKARLIPHLPPDHPFRLQHAMQSDPGLPLGSTAPSTSEELLSMLDKKQRATLDAAVSEVFAEIMGKNVQPKDSVIHASEENVPSTGPMRPGIP